MTTTIGDPPRNAGPRRPTILVTEAVRVITAETDLTDREAHLLLRFHARLTRTRLDDLAWSTLTGQTGTEQLLWFEQPSWPARW